MKKLRVSERAAQHLKVDIDNKDLSRQQRRLIERKLLKKMKSNEKEKA